MKTFSIDIRKSETSSIEALFHILRSKEYSVQPSDDVVYTHYLSNFCLDDGFCYDFEYVPTPERNNYSLPRDLDKVILAIWE